MDPTPQERLGHLRHALEDAESDLLEGRLTRASERISDARGIAVHLVDKVDPGNGAALELNRLRSLAPHDIPCDCQSKGEFDWSSHTMECPRYLIGKFLAEAEPVAVPFAGEAEQGESEMSAAVRVLLDELAGNEPAWWVKAGRAVATLERLVPRRSK